MPRGGDLNHSCPSQMLVLRQLATVVYPDPYFAPWGATRGGLAESMEIPLARVSGILFRALNNGYIVKCGLSRIRLPNGKNLPRRIESYRLTEKGLRVIES